MTNKTALQTALEALKIYADSSYFEKSHYEAAVSDSGSWVSTRTPVKVITFNYDETVAQKAVAKIENLIK